MPGIRILSLFAMGMVIASASSSSEAQIVRLSEKDAGSTVTLARGTVLEITLAANPATGFSWQPTTIEPSMLKYLGSDFAGKHATLGGEGRVFLRFQAVASGKSELELGYYRHPFEPVTETVERFLVTVIVTP
jgi:inhibitor of cysteine peptidase